MADPDDTPTGTTWGQLASASQILQNVKVHQIESLDHVVVRDKVQDIKLKWIVARVALAVMGIQLAVADLIFVFYGEAKNWQLSTPAIDSFLGATVIEVIGIVAVIANYLFPKQGKEEKL
jgi:hypothetical protein